MILTWWDLWFKRMYYAFYLCVIIYIIIIIWTNSCSEQNTFTSCYNKPLHVWEPRFLQYKESSYYDAFTEMIEILNFKFLKCIKLITIILQSVNTNSIKSAVCPQSSFGVLKNCGAQTNLASHMRFAEDYSETLEVFFATNKMVLHLIGVCRYALT